MAVPVELKHLVEPLEKLIEVVEARVSGVRRDGKAVYAEIERSYEESVRAIESAWHQCTLEALAVEAKQIEVRGERYTRVATGNGTYYSVAGPVEVRRGLYRKVGERNAKVIDVISLRAGVIGDGWLPRTAQLAQKHLGAFSASGGIQLLWNAFREFASGATRLRLASYAYGCQPSSGMFVLLAELALSAVETGGLINSDDWSMYATAIVGALEPYVQVYAPTTPGPKDGFEEFSACNHDQCRLTQPTLFKKLLDNKKHDLNCKEFSNIIARHLPGL